MRGRDLEHWDLEDKWDDSWQPPFINGRALRAWQKIGVTFVLRRYFEGKRFAWVGDEMGIGKVPSA
jgi:hypothetical protein